MRLPKEIAALVFWFFLFAAIPAAFLYPLALWMVKHTQISWEVLSEGYGFAAALLFVPTGLSVDFVYRHFFLKRRAKKLQNVTANPN